MRSVPRLPPLILCASAALAAPGCSSNTATGPCDAVFRFENVRKDSGGKGLDEWNDLARILRRYSKDALPTPATSNRRTLPGGEVRTCEVTVTLRSVADLEHVEADLQVLANQHAGERRLDFSLDRARMLYKSNFVAAGLEVTLRGVTSSGYRVGIYATADGIPTITYAGRGGSWSIKLPAVPEDRYVYGYSQDPDGHVRTRFFRINVVSMLQEAVTREEFLQVITKDPDRYPPPDAKPR